MIAPTIYRPLPEGHAWIVTWIDDKPIVVVNSRLSAREQHVARLHAQRILRGRRAAFLPFPIVVGLDIARRFGREHPVPVAVVAAVAGAGIYAAGSMAFQESPRQVAEPPPVVITRLAPSMMTPAPTSRPTPSGTRRSRPTPFQSTSPPSASPHTSPTRTTSNSPPTTSGSPVPEQAPTITTGSPPTATETGPGPEPTVATTPTTTGTPPQTGPPIEVAGCSGIHLQIPLDPLLDLDACLLD